MGSTPSTLLRSSILDRTPSASASITPLQSQVDGLVGGFATQATDWRSLASMSAGGMAYRAGRIGMMGLGSGNLVRAASIAVGFSAEVVTFEGTHRGLTALSGEASANPNLFRWNGSGGLRQGLLNSAVTFGTLKGAGHLASGQNFIAQHLLQDTGMVLGHQFAGALGISPGPTGTLAEQFLHAEATNLQLGAGMALAHGMTPGLHSLERGLDLSLQTGSAVPARSERESHPLGLRPTFAVAGEGPGAPVESRSEPKGPTILMMNDAAERPGSNPDTGSGRPGSAPSAPSIPVPSSFPDPTPTPAGGGGARRSSGGTRKWVGRAMAAVTSFGRWFNVNAFFNPDAPLPRAETDSRAPQVRSVQEGIDRARAAGHSRRALAFLRWGAHQLREQPEVQAQFLNLMERLFHFQGEMRGGWDEVLRNLPEADSREVNEKAGRYHEALEALTPGSGRFYAEAVLLNERTRELKNEWDYLNLTETQMREMGLDPNVLISLPRNAHAFTAHELLAPLEHPLLRDKPETETLRKAIEAHEGGMEILSARLAELAQKVENIRNRMAETQDVAERKRMERLIREEAEELNKTYEPMVEALNEAMARYLMDPLRSTVFMVENARRATLVRGLQDWNRQELTQYVGQRLADLPPVARTAAEELVLRSQQYDLVSDRGPLGRLFYGVARFINLDPLSPQEVRGRYEDALGVLIQEAPADFWRLEGPRSAEALEAARSAQNEFHASYDGWTRDLRDRLAPLEEANNRFWRRYDEGVVSLYVLDLQLQVAQAAGHVERARERLGDRMRDTPKGRQVSLEAEFTSLMLNLQSAIEKLNDPTLKDRSSRSFNRCLEAALENAQQLRTLARRALKQARLSGGDFKPVSALALPYAEKKNDSWLTRPGGSLGAILPILDHTVPAVGRLASTVKRGESVAVTDRIFQKWAVEMTGQHWLSRLFGTRHRYLIDEHADHLVEDNSLVIAGNHNSWLDFARGPTPGVRAAQLRGRDTHRDAVRILAKQGLGKLVGPVFEDAINLLTESVGDSIPEYDGSVTRASRAMAFGDLPNAATIAKGKAHTRLGPRSAAAYDELTMSVASLVNLYAFDPFPTISSILRIPQGGRSFNIADRALSLTGRPQNLLLTTTLNAYRLYPKPDRPFPLRRGQLVTATQLFPHLALTTPEADAANGPGESRANWLRTYWLQMATTPEHDRSVDSIDRIFEDFQRPVDPAVEQTLQNLFGGAAGVFPTESALIATRRRVSELQTQLNNPAPGTRDDLTRNLEAARGALRETELAYYQTPAGREALRREGEYLWTQLKRATFDLDDARISGANRRETSEIEDQVRHRLQIVENLKARVERNQPLPERELNDWLNVAEAIRAQQVYPFTSRLIDGLNHQIAFVSESNLPSRRRILSILRTRRAQVSLAAARRMAGESWTPTEEVLIANLEGSLVGGRNPSGYQDALVSAVESRDFSQIDALLREETIRESTRRLVRRLPGGGRGSIDSVRESAEDVSRVIRDGVGQVIEGPRSPLATWNFLGRFVGGCLTMIGTSMIDWALRSSNVSNSTYAPIVRFAMGAARWRPVLSAEDVRTLEEVRVRSQRENRPVVIAANHASWTDITTLMAVVPESRFIAKSALKYVPLLGIILMGGRHTLLDRPKENQGEEGKNRALRQVAEAGERMTRYGVDTVFFLPGTRSLTGTVGDPKSGAAGLALDTNSLLLVASLNGTGQVMPVSWGRFFGDGTGTHRRVGTRFQLLDPRDVRSNPDKTDKRDISTLTRRTEAIMTDLFLDQMTELRTQANEGDLMAQAQLAETYDLTAPGMDFIRRGDTAAAKEWAKKNKTSYAFLARLTEWWNN